METCKKCGAHLPPGALYCPMCGRAVNPQRQKKKQRGNGQGSVYQLPNGKYKAVVILGYHTDDKGGLHKTTRSKVFDRKKDAVAALPGLKDAVKIGRARVTLKQLYDMWFPTHDIKSNGTKRAYKAAMDAYKPLWGKPLEDIGIDEIQSCIDACSSGTRHKAKTVLTLMYKYAIPRKIGAETINLAQYVKAGGTKTPRRQSFDAEQIERIREAVGKVEYADLVYCHIYLGFRPGELLKLTSADYDRERQTLTGGSKTAAGKNRVVTISPKIRDLVQSYADRGGKTIFCSGNGRRITENRYRGIIFPAVLDAVGIDNPILISEDGSRMHKYTPHSCRHTFSTLMKRVEGAEKDKLELMGHASGEMLRYYQDVSLDDLRQITDKI